MRSGMSTDCPLTMLPEGRFSPTPVLGGVPGLPPKIMRIKLSLAGNSYHSVPENGGHDMKYAFF